MADIDHRRAYCLYHAPSRSWRCWCVVSCGYVGERRPSRDAALADRDEHLRSVGAPVLPEWPDPAKQLSLFAEAIA